MKLLLQNKNSPTIQYVIRHSDENGMHLIRQMFSFVEFALKFSVSSMELTGENEVHIIMTVGKSQYSTNEALSFSLYLVL